MLSDKASSLVLGYAEAAEVLRAEVSRVFEKHQLETLSLGLREARGQVLAAALTADRDQPPFDRSTRDGFACRSIEVNAQPLHIVGVERAGELWAGELAPGQALEIMTGAPVPANADCVVMVEHTVRENNVVRMKGERCLRPAENIVLAGAEARQGDVLIPVGTRLAPRHIAVAASCGQSNLRVYRQARIAIQATGDELAEIGETLLPFQIRNSNSYTLLALVEQCGGEAVVQPILRDDQAETRAAIAHMVDEQQADLLILTGGVSMGKYDFVEEALKSLGAEFFFTGVRMQPGKPVVFGRLRSTKAGGWTYFFGLPGNPISTIVTFALFVHPLLNALAGQSGGAPRFALARLTADVGITSGLTRFLPAVLEDENLLPQVRLLPWQGSGNLAGNARANCYLIVPEKLDDGREELKAGAIVSVLLIG